MSWNNLSSIPLACCKVQPENECSQSHRTLSLADCMAPLLINPLLTSSQPSSNRWMLVLDVPLCYGIATVTAAVIPYKMSGEFLWKWKYTSHSQGSLFLLWGCIEQGCDQSLLSPFLAHHTLDRRYMSGITSYGKMELKLCTVLPLDLTLVLSWSPQKEEGIRGFSATVLFEEEINFWKIRA